MLGKFNQEYILNAILALGILGLIYMFATLHHEQPKMPQFNKEDLEITEQPSQATETVYREGSGRFAQVGQTELFRTLIPRPTPKPKPTRQPPKPPEIDKLINYWQLLAVMGDEAYLQDRRTKKEFSLKAGDEYSVKYRGKDYKVKLTKLTDESVTFEFEGQAKTLTVY